MGNISKLGYLIRFVRHAIWAVSLLFPVPAVTFNSEKS
jgi:hypothetical protein